MLAVSTPDLLEEDRISSLSLFICYEKEAMEDGKAGSHGSGEFVGQICLMFRLSSVIWKKMI